MRHRRRTQQGLPKALSLKRRLRTGMTPAEQVIWTKLRSKQCDSFKFRRQHAIGPFIVDFFCPEQLLVVEIDGDVHAEKTQRTKDLEREKSLRSLGLRVIRYTNHDVLNNLDGVLEHLLGVLSRTLPPLTPPYKGGESGENDHCSNDIQPVFYDDRKV